MSPMNTPADNDRHAKDLTQLSSREQLSALMDGALPADQTRFLLRRLQHDASLADSWARWRLCGEVMRGLAPAQRLPADFASRVSDALHAEVVASGYMATPVARKPVWLRWGGGVAVAASLAVVALMARQPTSHTQADRQAPEVASSSAVLGAPARAPVPVPQSPGTLADAPQALAAVGAAVVRPARNRDAQVSRGSRASSMASPSAARAQAQAGALATTAEALPITAQPEIVTRPWPRSVLSQYSDSAITVGFGDHLLRSDPGYNPFPSPVLRGVASPASATATPAADTGTTGESGNAAAQLQP